MTYININVLNIVLILLLHKQDHDIESKYIVNAWTTVKFLRCKNLWAPSPQSLLQIDFKHILLNNH